MGPDRNFGVESIGIQDERTNAGHGTKAYGTLAE